MIEEIFIELAKQSPLVAVLVSAIIYLVRQNKKKEDKLEDLAEKSIKAIALYDTHITDVNSIQKVNTNEHRELIDLAKASYSILKDIKGGVI